MAVTLRIAVGSCSAAKLEAARMGFAAVYPTHLIELSSAEAASGIPEQPYGDEETRKGAVNRANSCANLFPGAHFAVGFEGGLHGEGNQMFCFAWVAVKELSTNKLGLARSGSFPVDPAVSALVNTGIELGHAVDSVYKTTAGKGRGGLVGIVTQGVITRESFYSHALVLALSTFTAPRLGAP